MRAGCFPVGALGWLRGALAALVLAAALTATLMPSSAFADDDDNLVNPQQLPDSSFIYDTSIAALGNADAYYDNQTVQVVGEAIGDSIREGLDNRHRWITLAANEKDSTATVSVLMTAEQAAKIDTYDLVCTEHEGLTDLHADIVTVVEKGKHHEDEFDVNAFVPGAIATALGLALMGVFYYLRERQR